MDQGLSWAKLEVVMVSCYRNTISDDDDDEISAFFKIYCSSNSVLKQDMKPIVSVQQKYWNKLSVTALRSDEIERHSREVGKSFPKCQ